MKLVRYTAAGDERIGALVGERKVADFLSAGVCASSSMRSFLCRGHDAMASARDLVAQAESDPGAAFVRDVADVELLAPVGDPQKVICVGQNYRDHCAEQNQPLPETAIIFAKFPTAITGPGAPIVLPKLSSQVDYEAELAFVIGAGGRNIPEASARDHIAGYMCLNDVSARDIQFADKQWVRGKTFDTFAPIGPALVTADAVSDPHALDISLTLNGAVMQKSNTSNLIFGVYYLVSYLSQVMTLEPGDIVTTGTPGGVGVFRTPQVFLKPGDTVSVTIFGLGTLSNPVVAEA